MNVKEAIETRRAYRSLAPVDITDDVVTALVDAARLSASCFNNQPWRYVFVRDRAVLNEMFGALTEGNRWATAASMIVAVFSRPDLDCQIRDRQYHLFDTGMATAFMILRATELGLVAHPIAGFSPKKVRKVLHIPDDMTVITIVIVGKHAQQINDLLSKNQAETETERPERKAAREFAFVDRYTGREEGVS
ncbi:MAG: nitroreductase family protein [Candidatus Eisenbacteria bacterium]|nr:nitroreductase family protein [Candidatus Eisenbacteria bacterium]